MYCIHYTVYSIQYIHSVYSAVIHCIVYTQYVLYTVDSVICTQYTSIQYTLYNLHTLQRMPYIVNFKTLKYIAHSMHCTLQCTLYSLHYTLCSIHYTLYTMQYTLYTIHYTLYTLHTIHYTLYTIHYTLCRLQNIMLQNEEVCGNTIYSSSKASGVNHIIHRSRRLM